MKKKVSFLEAIIILLLLLIILGISVIKFGLMPEVPVLFTVCLLVFWLRLRGNDWASIQDGIKEGIGVAILYFYPNWGLDWLMDQGQYHPFNYGSWLSLN